MPVSSATVLRLAETYALTAYDAEYIALSEWMEIPAVSYDSDLTDSGLATHPDRF
jgi:predicted nucleic acid-binding protein